MASRPEDEAVVISNGEDIYVWRPEEERNLDRVFGSNPITDRVKSFLKPVSSKMNFFNIQIQGYLPDQDNDLWLNPQGAAMYIKRGEIGKLRENIPAQIRFKDEAIETSVEFKYQLTQSETVDTIICSKRKSPRKANLVENNITINLDKEMFENKFKAENNPLRFN